MSLYREVLYSNSPLLKHQDKFFGNYKDLNNIEVPTNSEIATFQKQKLMEFQTQAFKNDSKTVKLNEFLRLNGVLAKSSEPYDQLVYDKMNNLFVQINSLIKEGYMHKKNRSNLKEDQQLEKEIIAKLQILGDSLNTLRANANMVISSSYIDQLDAIVKSLPQGDIDLVLRTLYHLKGDILEEIGVEWANKRIPSNLNIKGFSTGSVRGEKGQLIQDLLFVDMDNINLLNTEMTYNLGNEIITTTLGNFLKKVESYSGTLQISIGDEGERLLQEISLLGVQAKSGVNQLPWNVKSKNTFVPIQGDKNSFDQYCLFLEKIEQLRNSTNWNGKDNIKKESPIYKAMANYELANSLSKVLHLSQNANQYVLTPNGFMPFVSRIMELYEKKGGVNNNYYFSFKGKIQLTDANDILVKQRPVILGI